ncbi:MAG TPA: helix-turn-helix domain-containing protein [Candidatus Nanoarchaeia archaeon]|nr:helix-turn-helix domain-containing protein [Candidatus Nanoarchaeia archaeon]
MIVREELMSKLRRYFNLNLYEVRIWTALLSRGVSTAGELSDIGHVPRSRSYDVLESLEKKGFVVMKLGKPIKYIAVEPTEVVERVKKLIHQEAENNVQKLRELSATDVLKELESLHKQGIEFIDATDLSGAIRGKQNLYAHLETMVKQAEKSVTIVTTSKGLVRKIEALKPILQKLAKKDVKIRIAAPMSKEAENLVKEIKGIADIRHTTDLNARFCIVDSKQVMFMVMHDDLVHPSYDIGIWVQTPFFATALENLVNNSWKNYEPITLNSTKK